MSESIELEVYEKDKLVAEIYVSGDRKTVTMTPHNITMLNNPLPMKNPIVKDVADYLENRCFPYERDQRQMILGLMGLEYYNPIEIIKETYGLIHEDYIWLKFKGDPVTYEDIKIRE